MEYVWFFDLFPAPHLSLLDLRQCKRLIKPHERTRRFESRCQQNLALGLDIHEKPKLDRLKTNNFPNYFYFESAQLPNSQPEGLQKTKGQKRKFVN